MANQAKGGSRWAIPPTTQTTIAVDIPQETELTLRQDCGKLPTASPYVHQRQASGMFRPCSRLRTFHDSSVKSLYDALNIEHTRGKSNSLGVGGCERQSVPGIENVFVLFREQSIGCNRIGCL